MNPCTIALLTSIYIVTSLRNNQIESAKKLGNGQSEGSSILNVTYIDVDLRKKESTNHYIYNKIDNVETYTAKDGFAIKKYTDGADVNWESNGTLYLTRVIKTKQTEGTFKYQVVKYDPTQSSVPSIIIVVTQVGDDVTKSKENDNPLYDFKQNKDLVTYKLKKEVNFPRAKVGTNGGLKQESEEREKKIKSVLFNTRAKTIVFVFEENISVYKINDGRWYQAYYGKPKTVKLNLMKKKNTDKYDYTNENGIGTYVAKDGYFFNVVKRSCSIWGSSCCTSDCWSWLCCLGSICSDFCCCLSGCCTCPRTIYKAAEFKHYAIRVVSDGLSCCSKIKNVTIDLVNGQSKYFYNNIGELVETKGTMTLSIDLSRKQSTPYYDYVCENNRHVYTAKYACCFNSLEYSVSSKTPPVVIWKPPDRDSYIVKVVLDESSEENVIKAYLANGMNKTFTKSDGKWTEKTETKPT